MTKQIKRASRGRVTDEQAHEEDKIRRKAMQDFPPKVAKRPVPATGIAAQLRRARKAQKLTWYAVAKKAGIPNPNTVRDIEQGADARLSNVEAVAKALALSLAVQEV